MIHSRESVTAVQQIQLKCRLDNAPLECVCNRQKSLANVNSEQFVMLLWCIWAYDERTGKYNEGKKHNVIDSVLIKT